jgi:hypothetical protein
MKLERESMLQILTGITPAIPKKGDEDMVKKVVFTGTDAVAYSEDLVIAWPFTTDFQSVVPSDELASILRKSNSAEVDLEHKGHNLTIKMANMRARLKTEPESVLITEIGEGVMKEADDASWFEFKEPEVFKKAVNLCSYSASKDSTQIALTCVYVAGNSVVASDDFRISQYLLPEEFPEEVLMKATSCVSMNRFLFTRYAITGHWVMFLDENDVMLAIRWVDEQYGDVSQYMQFEGQDYELPSNLAQKVEQVSVMAKGDYDIEKEIRVTLKNGAAVVMAEKNTGWAEATVKHAGLVVERPVTFTINPLFFAEVLRLTNNLVTIGDDKALFKQGDFTHLISLSLIE